VPVPPADRHRSASKASHRAGRDLAAIAVLCLTVPLPCPVAAEVGAGLPPYEPVAELQGKLLSVGSDTLGRLMTRWAEAFTRHHPRVGVEIHAAGSSTAPVALAQGAANLGPMSRPMDASERLAFENRRGHGPTAVRVALDGVALVVHGDNPVEGLTLPEVDAIFSVTRYCGRSRPVERWRELGVAGELGDRRPRAFGRTASSGTRGYFRERALCGGDYAPTVNERPGNGSVLQAVAASTSAIGYSSLAFRSARVRQVPVATERGRPYVLPLPESVARGEYPLSRTLYVYFDKPPGGLPAAVVREFLLFALSREGQRIVERTGLVPLPSEVVERERATVD
jgi:phosphate transport system substrate-binding protein